MLSSCSLIEAAGPIEQRIEHKHTQTRRKHTENAHNKHTEDNNEKKEKVTS